MNNPVQGSWQLGVVGVSVPEGTTQYNTIMSTRAGTVVTPPPVSGGSFPFVILILALAGGGIGVYVYSNSLKRTAGRKVPTGSARASTGWYRRDVCQSNHGPAGWSGDRTWFHQRPPIE